MKTKMIVNIDEERLIAMLRNAAQSFDSAGGESSLDFSSVRRIHPSGMQALEELARVAEEREVRVTLRGVQVDVYKALKLLKLAGRFSFEN